eukprot:787065-Rhodomonas_salina.4
MPSKHPARYARHWHRTKTYAQCPVPASVAQPSHLLHPAVSTHVPIKHATGTLARVMSAPGSAEAASGEHTARGKCRDICYVLSIA